MTTGIRAVRQVHGETPVKLYVKLAEQICDSRDKSGSSRTWSSSNSIITGESFKQHWFLLYRHKRKTILWTEEENTNIKKKLTAM